MNEWKDTLYYFRFVVDSQKVLSFSGIIGNLLEKNLFLKNYFSDAVR